MAADFTEWGNDDAKFEAASERVIQVCAVDGTLLMLVLGAVFLEEISWKQSE